MTMLSPLGKLPRRPPAQRRRGRRAWPMVVFVTVFAVAAVVVWWRVINADDKRQEHASCSSSSSASPGLTAHDVQVRIYNATPRSGLAATVSKSLRGSGLQVISIANDPTSRKVTGIAEIRYGENGARQAALLRAAFPGATLLRDKRTDATVDVAVGPRYRKLADSATIQRAVGALTTSTRPSPKPC